MSDDEGWTTVQKKTRTKKPKESQIGDNFTEPEDDWNTNIVLRRKPDRSKAAQRKAIREGRYVSVATGKSGQDKNYDPRHMAKIDNETEAFKLKTVTKDFSTKIQQARNSLQWTQKDLAKKMNVTVDVVMQYEKGTAVADGPTIQKFKNILKI